MKKFLFLIPVSLLIFSCGSDKPEVNIDSLRTDSALKAQGSMKPDIQTRSKDTMHMVTLPPVMEGDLVFQIDTSEQCMAFGKASGSKYNNIGMIFIRPHDKLYMVLEAKDSVHVMPLTEWVDRGQGDHVALMRVKHANQFLTPRKTADLKNQMKELKGKMNDHYFSWSDDEMYSSEMVWKVYTKALNIVLSTPRKLSEYDLTGALVKQQMQNHYKGNIPQNEKVVSPDDLYKSDQLELIYEK
jgi:hypothetical protein